MDFNNIDTFLFNSITNAKALSLARNGSIIYVKLPNNKTVKAKALSDISSTNVAVVKDGTNYYCFSHSSPVMLSQSIKSNVFNVKRKERGNYYKLFLIKWTGITLQKLIIQRYFDDGINTPVYHDTITSAIFSQEPFSYNLPIPSSIRFSRFNINNSYQDIYTSTPTITNQQFVDKWTIDNSTQRKELITSSSTLTTLNYAILGLVNSIVISTEVLANDLELVIPILFIESGSRDLSTYELNIDDPTTVSYFDTTNPSSIIFSHTIETGFFYNDYYNVLNGFNPYLISGFDPNIYDYRLIDDGFKWLEIYNTQTDEIAVQYSELFYDPPLFDNPSVDFITGSF
jgi:hypothetical protein